MWYLRARRSPHSGLICRLGNARSDAFTLDDGMPRQGRGLERLGLGGEEIIPHNLSHALVPESRAGLVKMLSLRPVLVVVFLAAAGVADAAPFEDGQAAYDRHDYATALQDWQPLADPGDAKAQNKLGNMFADGQGVAQDFAEALKWYRLAADQRLANAQINLGVMYAGGRGVPQDYAEAVKSVSLGS